MNSSPGIFLIAAHSLVWLITMAGLPDSGNAQSPETIRMVTINVWSGLDYRGYFKMGEYEDAAIRKQRHEVLIEQLRELAPDVVALNEANQLPGYVRQLAGPGLFWTVPSGDSIPPTILGCLQKSRCDDLVRTDYDNCKTRIHAPPFPGKLDGLARIIRTALAAGVWFRNCPAMQNHFVVLLR
jgi:hypothetical protein